MLVYIIPITALLLSFMSLLASLRFIFSRQGLYWVFPAIISTLLFFQNLDTLLILGESGIAVFEYTFRNFVAENRFESDSRKNRAEAEYLMKVEMRKTRKVRKEKVKYIENKAGIPEIPEYDSPDID